MRLHIEQKAIKLNKAFLIAISEDVYKNTVKHFKNISSGIALIYNGVDEKEFDYRLKNNADKGLFGFKKDDVIVTYVARITEGKDHLTLLKAWKMAAAKVPGAKLCLAGDGELTTQMKEFCAKENIEESVIFLGTVKDVRKLLAVTDIGVFTSLFEGFSIAVLEQMFMQVPVIATDIPPFSQLIENEKNGFLIKAGNFESLCNLILKLIIDKELRETVGKAGYIIAQKFSLAEMIKKHDEVYNAQTV